jgi:tripartite-type tricarboxylate transporter receptor subunit TctC
MIKNLHGAPRIGGWSRSADREIFMKKNNAMLRFTMALAAPLICLGATAPATAADFYAGKTIRFVVGADVGGGYDIYSRTISRTWPDFIPGKPTIVVQNMPGAGSGRAAGYMQNIAPKDGTYIAALMPGAIIGPLLDDKMKGQYDPTKFQYLGTADSGTRVCVTSINSKVKTLKDAMTQEVKMGASQSGGSTVDYAAMVRNATGAKVKIVAGYKGTAEIGLAIERGEVDGLCGWDWASLKAQKPDWLRDKKINILVQFGQDPEPELVKLGVPQFTSFIKDDAVKQAAEVVMAQQIFGRPYIAPPGVPAAEIETLRSSFMKTVADPKFIEDAKKARIDVSAMAGDKVQAIVNKIYGNPKDVIVRAKSLIKP